MSHIGATASGFPPVQFISQSFVSSGQTLQQAIDAAPASSSLVTTITSGITSFGGGLYGVPASSKPSAFFIDAMFAQEAPGAFNGTALSDPTGQLYPNNAYIWTYDAPNSRIICYNKGLAVTEATCANYHAVVAATTTTYDSIVLRPGIYVVGLGAGSSEIKAISGQTINMVLGGSSGSYIFTVAAASYSGIVGFDIVRNNATFEKAYSGFFGLCFPTESSSDAFVARDCHIYVESSVIEPAGYYNVGIFFAPYSLRNTRAKNVQFVNCKIESQSGVDVLETYSQQFYGLVFFRDCTISGGMFIDGKNNTFSLINTKYTNFNSYNGGRVQQRAVDINFAINFGSSGPFDGYTHDYIAINSPHYIQRPDDIYLTETCAFSIFGNNRVPKSFYNSPVYGSKLLLRPTGAVTAAFASIFSSKNSPMTPLEITAVTGSGYTLTSPTPVIQKSFTQQSYSTQGSTPSQFGILNILYRDLAEIGGAKIYIRGRFASNSNAKTLTAKCGVGSSLSGIVLANISGANWSGAFNGSPFEYEVDVKLSNATVLISGSLTSPAIGATTHYLAEQAISDGQYLQLVLNANATVDGDISVVYQSAEIDC